MKQSMDIVWSGGVNVICPVQNTPSINNTLLYLAKESRDRPICMDWCWPETSSPRSSARNHDRYKALHSPSADIECCCWNALAEKLPEPPDVKAQKKLVMAVEPLAAHH